MGSVITEQLKTSGDIALHLNPRFDDRMVVRNSRHKMVWGPEEREPRVMPFIAGREFEAMILCEESGYKIAINGQHFVEFLHRIPLSCCGVLNIDGTIEISRIEFRREMRYIPPQNPVPVVNPSVALQPIFNPPLPFHQKFSEGLRNGFMIYISGRLHQSPDRFSIDLLSTTLSHNDIAFHLNIRVRDSMVVRNCYQSGKWGEEERQIPHFPFYAGVNFDLIIRVETNQYLIAVNGQHFLQFKHRIPHNFVNGMNINGDVVITSIRFSNN